MSESWFICMKRAPFSLTIFSDKLDDGVSEGSLLSRVSPPRPTDNKEGAPVICFHKATFISLNISAHYNICIFF